MNNTNPIYLLDESFKGAILAATLAPLSLMPGSKQAAKDFVRETGSKVIQVSKPFGQKIKKSLTKGKLKKAFKGYLEKVNRQST